MARVVLAAQMCAVALLAWSLPACCCGPLPPKPGPPGFISGEIQRPPTTTPVALAVYAVDALNSGANYVVTYVPATESTYQLVVPPGEYHVVARMDNDPLAAGGFTFNVMCSASGTCGGNAGNHTLFFVRVESEQSVSGITIGDWGTGNAQALIWYVDVSGSPLSLTPQVSPSPRQLASRQLPAVSSTDATIGYTSSLLGASLQIPVGWAEIKPPPSVLYPTERYFANQPVHDPLALDSQGVWLTTQIRTGQGCPFPDWRYATSRATITMQGGANHFFFEDPPPRGGPQPFAGYTVRGGTFVFGNCVEFIFTGVTREALENNLVPFFLMMESAQFVPPS